MEFEKIRSVIAEQMNIAEEKITVETSFANDLGADSLDVFQIISELEEAFDIEFTDENIKLIKTVGDAAEYIKRTL